MKVQVPMRIKVLRPLAGIAMMVQRGKSELLAPVSVSPGEIVFEFEIAADLTGPTPNFLGRYAQGPKSERFVYVNSGTSAHQIGSPWTRRAKISLMSITREQVEKAAASGTPLTTEFQGVGRDGGPTCASVKGVVWKVAA